ncbi:MAG: uracil-DNA glycosylase [Planctomycetota bacterium]|nr:uracil-DNA glycosylase [Planctomycetota bacterium]
MTDPRALHAAAVLLGQAQRAGIQLVPPVPAVHAGLNVLPSLNAEIAACTRCPLAATRTRTVPGEGALPARLMVIGEGPGAEEDRTGRPFVGAAGQLLDKILAAGMGMRREEVFIANLVKCRPPGNRDPAPEETAACAPYLERQIAAVQPALLLALGRHAAQHLTASSASLGALRGRLHARPGGGPPVLVTYHPAYLLRNPAAKRECWEDVQRAMTHLGLTPPASEADRAKESGNQPSEPR